jgi:hypothetical protein
MKRRGWLVAVISVSLLGACSGSTDAHTAARNRWEQSVRPDYTLEYRVHCDDCGHDGEWVTRVYRSGELAGGSAARSVLEQFPDVADLFELAESAEGVEYDPDLGFPMDVEGDGRRFSGVSVVFDIDEAIERFEDARERWLASEPDSYLITYYRGSQTNWGTYVVRVEGDVKTLVRFEDPYPEDPPDALYSVRDLFDIIDRALSTPYYLSTIRYDPSGYPTTARFDMNAGGADDSFYFTDIEVTTD